MEFTTISAADQIISWFAVVALEALFIVADTPRRPALWKILLGNMAGLLFVMTYFPYYRMARLTINIVETILIYTWWCIFYFGTVIFCLWLYDLTPGAAMFRCIMGMCLYSIGNTLIKNLCVGIWFPNLAEVNLPLYILINIFCYVCLGTGGYFLLASNMRSIRKWNGLDTGMAYGFLGGMIIFSNIVWDISNGIFEHTVELLRSFQEYSVLVRSVQYFCAVTSIVFSIFVIGILFMFYKISFLQQEEVMIRYLQSEKEKQYEYTRQNMDIINQKCHDLKRQIYALRFSKEDEKEALFQETLNVADFFDYIVKTDNEILNTILMEKGLICHNKRIRMTCTVNGCDFSQISVIDLYMILSNVLDNAIECVEQYEEDEKKIISVHISQPGNMNYIMAENYFEGELHIQNGQIMTSKEDTYCHGFGIRSIQMLVKKYRGNTRISTGNHTFSIQIILPCKKI